MAEELWTEHMEKPYSIHQQPWPEFDAEAAKEDSIEIPVQINGKLRDKVIVPADASQADIESAALATEGAQKYLDGKEPRKVIVVQKRLVNIVV
jgi:leucyl-tRNA synthetase